MPADADVADSDQPSGFHTVTMNWTLKNVDGSTMTACPAGFTKIWANFYRNHDGQIAPDEAQAIIDCTPTGTVTRQVATSGRTYLPDGSYYPFVPQKDFIIVVTEETLTAEAARTPYYYVEALTTDLTLDFDIYPAGGRGTMAWELTSMNTTAALASCAAAGVDTIETAIRPFDDTGAPLVVVGSWPCTANDPYSYYEPNGNGFALIDQPYELGSGMTAGIAEGTYFAEARAKRGNAIVGTSDGQLVIETKNDVNPFYFPTSNCSFGSNCIVITDR